MTAYRSLSPSLNWRSATCFRQILLILLILLDTAGYWSGRAAMAGGRSDALGTSGSPPALTTPCTRNPDRNTGRPPHGSVHSGPVSSQLTHLLRSQLAHPSQRPERHFPRFGNRSLVTFMSKVGAHCAAGDALAGQQDAPSARWSVLSPATPRRSLAAQSRHTTPCQLRRAQLLQRRRQTGKA